MKLKENFIAAQKNTMGDLLRNAEIVLNLKESSTIQRSLAMRY